MKTISRMTMPVGFFMIILLMQCSDDDAKLTGSIIGKWQGKSIEAKVVAFGIPVWQDEDDTFNPILEFLEGGTIKVYNDDQTTEGTWEKDGRRLYTNVDLNYEGFSGNQELEIKKLTETDLELYVEKDSTFKDPDSGIEVAGKLKATAYFRRIPD